MQSYQVFAGDDSAYYRWLETHMQGFVLNTRRNLSTDYMVLHSAMCPHISRPIHESTAGGFTERDYIKICADSVETLQDWMRAHGRPDGSFSSECQHCKPTVPH
jgi:hypothetical protein